MNVRNILNFNVDNVVPLTFTYDQYSDFGTANSLGNIQFDLRTNSGWYVTGQIRDDTTGGQTANDWNGTGWALTVNGTTINESSPTTIDSRPWAVNWSNRTWAVTLNIPWSEGPSTPDCAIVLTATSL